MSLVINTNVASLISQRNLTKNTQELTRTFERLSSGMRINRASDDAAGLSISESLRSQIRGNAQAINNIQDGINLLDIAESGLSVVNDNMQRIRELCIQAANGTNGSTERKAILNEIGARLDDINRIAKTSKFNNISLLDGNTPSTKLQTGAFAAISTNTIDIASALSDVRITTLNITLTPGTTGATWNPTKIRTFLTRIDSALSTVMTSRSNVGAYQNRLQSALESLTKMNENIKASDSRIRDLDIAQETSNMTKFQILQQASATVLAQSNSIPQLALSLLRQ